MGCDPQKMDLVTPTSRLQNKTDADIFIFLPSIDLLLQPLYKTVSVKEQLSNPDLFLSPGECSKQDDLSPSEAGVPRVSLLCPV